MCALLGAQGIIVMCRRRVPEKWGFRLPEINPRKRLNNDFFHFPSNFCSVSSSTTMKKHQMYQKILGRGGMKEIPITPYMDLPKLKPDFQVPDSSLTRQELKGT